MPMCFGTTCPTPVVIDFANALPKIHLDVSFSDRAVNFVDDFDVAIRIGKPQESALIARKVCDARIVVVAAPSYGAAGSPAERMRARRRDSGSSSSHPAVKGGLANTGAADLRGAGRSAYLFPKRGVRFRSDDPRRTREGTTTAAGEAEATPTSGLLLETPLCLDGA
ncbi:LysR substrate-binding domain-containing protein [Rhizobium grahamii]